MRSSFIEMLMVGVVVLMLFVDLKLNLLCWRHAPSSNVQT